jgi:hypothetical protein
VILPGGRQAGDLNESVIIGKAGARHREVILPGGRRAGDLNGSVIIGKAGARHLER